MNLRYPTFPYQAQCPYFYSVTPPNFIPWTNYPDIIPGCQYVPLIQYPPGTLIQFDPLLYTAPPTAPPYPVWRPRYPPNVVPPQQRFAAPSCNPVPRWPNPSATQQYVQQRCTTNSGKGSRTCDNLEMQTHTLVLPIDRDNRSHVSRAQRVSSEMKCMREEMSLPGHTKTNTTMLRGRRKVRRKRKTFPKRKTPMDTTDSVEISSIVMEGTQARLTKELQEIPNDDGDPEYETCEEEVVFPGRKAVLHEIKKSGKGTADSAPNTAKKSENTEKDNSLDFTTIGNDKSYSEINYNPDGIMLKIPVLDTSGKPENISSSKMNLLKKSLKNAAFFNTKAERDFPYPRTPFNSTAGHSVQSFQNTAGPDHDYWAALRSFQESLWDISASSDYSSPAHFQEKCYADSVYLTPHLKETRYCCCRNCRGEFSRENPSQSNQARMQYVEKCKTYLLPTTLPPNSPEMWWDRSSDIGYNKTVDRRDWRTNDENNNSMSKRRSNSTSNDSNMALVDSKDSSRSLDASDEYIVIDCNAGNHSNPRQSVTKILPHSDNISDSNNNNSSLQGKRRLLPVDWDSIHELSNKDLQDVVPEVNTSAPFTRVNVPSIAKLDNAIVEHGPLTNEQFSVHTLSMNDDRNKTGSISAKQSQQRTNYFNVKNRVSRLDSLESLEPTKDISSFRTNSENVTSQLSREDSLECDNHTPLATEPEETPAEEVFIQEKDKELNLQRALPATPELDKPLDMAREIMENNLMKSTPKQLFVAGRNTKNTPIPPKPALLPEKLTESKNKKSNELLQNRFHRSLSLPNIDAEDETREHNWNLKHVLNPANSCPAIYSEQKVRQPARQRCISTASYFRPHTSRVTKPQRSSREALKRKLALLKLHSQTQQAANDRKRRLKSNEEMTKENSESTKPEENNVRSDITAAVAVIGTQIHKRRSPRIASKSSQVFSLLPRPKNISLQSKFEESAQTKTSTKSETQAAKSKDIVSNQKPPRKAQSNQKFYQDSKPLPTLVELKDSENIRKKIPKCRTAPSTPAGSLVTSDNLRKYSISMDDIHTAFLFPDVTKTGLRKGDNLLQDQVTKDSLPNTKREFQKPASARKYSESSEITHEEKRATEQVENVISGKILTPDLVQDKVARNSFQAVPKVDETQKDKEESVNKSDSLSRVLEKSSKAEALKTTSFSNSSKSSTQVKGATGMDEKTRNLKLQKRGLFLSPTLSAEDACAKVQAVKHPYVWTKMTLSDPIALDACSQNHSRSVNDEPSRTLSFFNESNASMFLQPVVSSTAPRNARLCYINVNTYPQKPSKIPKQLGSPRTQLRKNPLPSLLPLPIVFSCDTSAELLHVSQNVVARQRPRVIPKRRRSMSCLHHSAMSRRMRQKTRTPYALAPDRLTKSILKDQARRINVSHPPYFLVHRKIGDAAKPSKPARFRERLVGQDEDSSRRFLSKTTSSIMTNTSLSSGNKTADSTSDITGKTGLDSTEMLKTILEYTEDTLGSCRQKTGKNFQLEVKEKKEDLQDNATESAITKENEETESQPDENQKTLKGKRAKSSFLKRIITIRHAKREKGEKAPPELRNFEDNEDPVQEKTKLSKTTTKTDLSAASKYFNDKHSHKLSRKERIRANFRNKKNQIFGKESKFTSKTSVVDEDPNANLREHLNSVTRKDLQQEIVKKGKENKAPNEEDPERVSNADENAQRRKEIKDIRSALHKPTFLCMAAIETPQNMVPEHNPISSLPLLSKENVEKKIEHPDPVQELCEWLDQSASTAMKRRRASVGTPGVRINSETGDVMDGADSKYLSNFLSSTAVGEIAECQNTPVMDECTPMKLHDCKMKQDVCSKPPKVPQTGCSISEVVEEANQLRSNVHNFRAQNNSINRSTEL